jgi:hypothetical protein
MVMDKEIARKLIEFAVALDKPLNEATALTAQISDVEERKTMRRGIAAVTGAAYSELIRPILREFPDLDPDPEQSKR